MMEPFERIDIQELPLSIPSFRHQVEDFLGSNGLRLGEVDLYLGVLDGDGDILAGGGLQRDIIKCLAVSPAARSMGLSVPLISRLLSIAADRGFTDVKVFTKPENRAMFESLGFKLLASAPKAILMENGRGLEDYCAFLRKHRAEGVIVMNANPFTLGHRYLVERAASEISPRGHSALVEMTKGAGDSLVEMTNDMHLSFRAEPEAESRNLVVIPVKEDVSRFPYSERMEMIRQGCGDLADVVEGSDYQISATTFPTYFLKDLSDAAETQMRLDIDLFGRHIAPALGATVRFVGSEPTDALTARYNALMQELLPKYGVRLVEIPRLTLGPSAASVASTGSATNSRTGRASAGESAELPEQEPVSASRVRKALDQGRFREAAALTPASTWPYLLAELAVRALRLELDTPLKPGLVGPDSVGAHADMDYSLMRKGIDAIRPFFPRMAVAGSPEELRQLGIDAERAMLAATGGVNTHRGAIFALGLALNAAGRRTEGVGSEQVMQNRVRQLAQSISDKSLTDSELHSTASSHGSRAVMAHGAKGAKQMALEGYRELFDSWLPFYIDFSTPPAAPLEMTGTLSTRPGMRPSPLSSRPSEARGELSRQMLLLKIMSELDDTCVIHRVGYERAQQVKAEAGEIAGQAGNDGKCQAGHDGKCQAGNDGQCRAGNDGKCRSGHDGESQTGHDGGSTGPFDKLRDHSPTVMPDQRVMPDPTVMSDQRVMPDPTVMPDLIGHLEEMCERYAAEGISPGGAADMLALTIFVDSILD